MRIYHRTFAAASILQNGFQDATKTYGTGLESTGVWVSDRPLDAGEGARGDTLLTLDIPTALFFEYEWVEEGKPYREALIPAAQLNAHGPPKSVAE